MLPTPDTTPAATDLPDAILDQALAACIVAPTLPDAFRSRVIAAVLTEQLQSFALRSQQLEAEHAKEMERLRRGHILLKRDTLILVAACAFASGICAQMVLPWFHSRFEIDSALTAPLVALLIGLAAGYSVWTERFGRPGFLIGILRR